MLNPEGLRMHAVTESDIAAGAPRGNLKGQFCCPECGTWVASKTVDGVPQSWAATGDDTTADGRRIDPENVWIENLSPSVRIDGDHQRTYPFSKRGETCPGWHGWYRNGRWER